MDTFIRDQRYALRQVFGRCASVFQDILKFCSDRKQMRFERLRKLGIE
jgi:hypothetical protein